LENYSKPPVRAEKTLGFDFLYEQKFAEVREVFASWESRNPEDPFGVVAVAASYLFEELYLQGVLTSDFFLNEKKFLHGIDGRPDPERMGHFRDALARARELARERQKPNPEDGEALFTLTLAAGMESDAESILQKKHGPCHGIRIGCFQPLSFASDYLLASRPCLCYLPLELN